MCQTINAFLQDNLLAIQSDLEALEKETTFDRLQKEFEFSSLTPEYDDMNDGN